MNVAKGNKRKQLVLNEYTQKKGQYCNVVKKKKKKEKKHTLKNQRRQHKLT